MKTGKSVMRGQRRTVLLQIVLTFLQEIFLLWLKKYTCDIRLANLCSLIIPDSGSTDVNEFRLRTKP